MSRRAPFTSGLFAGIVVLSVLPFWAGRFLPFADYPLLLSEVVVMRHLHDPAMAFDGFYTLQLNAFGYWGFHAPVYLLSWIFPIEIAGKMSLSLFAIGLLLALRHLLATFEKDPFLALLAVPLVYTVCLYVGLLSFLYTVPVLFLAIAAWHRACEEDRGVRLWRSRRGIAALLLSLLTYFAHIWAACLLMAAVALLFAAHRAPVRRLLYLAPMLVMIAVGLGASDAGDLFRHDFRGGFEFPHPSLSSPTTTIRQLWKGTVAFHGGRWDDVLFGLSLLLAASLALGVPSAWRGAWRSRAGRAGLILAAGMLIVYAFTPESIGSTSWLVPRTAVVALALCLLLPGADLRTLAPRRAGAIRAAIVLVAAAHVGLQILYVRRFEERAAPLADLIPQASRGGRTFGLFFDRRISESDSLSVMYHFAAYLQMHNGGDIADSSARFSNFKLKYLPGAQAPGISDFVPEDFRWDTHGSRSDRVLVFGAPEDSSGDAGDVPPARLPALLGELAQVKAHAVRTYRSGRWTLYEMR